MINNRWVQVGALSAAIAIAIGAFGAHGLRGRLLELEHQQAQQPLAEGDLPRQTPTAIFNTAADYQRTHALALIVTGILASIRQAKSLTIAAWCFLLGTVLFSGSLYLLALTGIRWLGAITPIGGVLFIAGWIVMAVGGLLGKQ